MKDSASAVSGTARFGLDFRPAEDFSLRIISYLSRFLTAGTAILAVVYLFSGYAPKVILISFVSLVFSIPLILMRFGKNHAAKIYFFIQFIFISLFVPVAVDEDARTEWVIILAPVLSVLMFNQGRHWMRLSMAFFGYLAIKTIYFYHDAWMNTTYPEIYRFFLAMTISAFLYWLVVLFKKETLRSDKIILQQNQQLLEQQEILAQQNGELLVANQTLDKQRISLQLLNEELRQFTHVASHDMKEPLRNISSFATLLSRRIENPDHREYLNFIESGAKRMSRMLEDLIVYARVGVENSPREAVNLNDVFFSTKMSLRAQVEQSGGRLEADELPTLQAHPTLLAQLFQNLIGNSLKYRRADVPPVVRVSFLEKNSGNENVCQLRFEDNGMGIEAENLEKIFEPFRRLHGQSEIEGSGIGLATCRKIADLYGGRIWAESEVGVGTLVVLELPVGMIERQI